MVRIEESWKQTLKDEFEKPYFKSLTEKVREEYKNPAFKVFPPGNRIFAAFDSCPFDKVKVVIIGQDPYHGEGQANGLCFSVAPGVSLPPSLVNIFKEIHDDTGRPIPNNGDLSGWANQGVLLLNSSLTVREGAPSSHAGMGWETFTDAVVNHLNLEKENLVFLLWGSYAIRKGEKIDRSKHLVLTSPHPSPLSAHRGFFGNHHFSQTNAFLRSHGKKEIEW